MDARIDVRDIVGATGFEQDCAACVTQDRHQRQHVFLDQGFATCDLDKWAIKCRHCIEDVCESSFAALVKRVLRVAVVAAKIAKSQSHENARLPYPSTLTLY